MKLEEYLEQLPSRRSLSDVKRKILKRLWGENESNFPKPWVSSLELLELTGQKYFDRRTRELRDQLGCDLESSYISDFAGHAWRINSATVAPPQNREYLTTSQKKQLFDKHHYTCATCGTITLAGIRGLQADHKVPLSRGGGNELANWQPMCNNCNVGKRRACEDCNLDCNTCSWAFPEVVGIPSLILLNEDTLRLAALLMKEGETSLSDIISQALQALADEKSKGI